MIQTTNQKSMTITPYFRLTKTGFCKTPMISSGQTSCVMCHIQVRAMILEVPYRIIMCIYIYMHTHIVFIYIYIHMVYADLIQLLILETNFRIPTVPTCSNMSGHGSWGTACSCCIDSTSQVGVPWLVHGKARDAGGFTAQVRSCSR